MPNGPVAGRDSRGPRYDIVLTGGTVVDPASGVHGATDVAIAGGAVGALGPNLAGEADRVIDCRGALVTPGLIDCHTHLFNAFTTLGAPVDDACVQRGVTVAADAGSAGCWTYAAFERYVVRSAPIPVFCFLNVSAIGIIDLKVGEAQNLEYVDEDAAIEMAARHPDVIKGFKVRLGEHMTGGSCLPLLERARRIGDGGRLPLMVHIGGSVESLVKVLAYLRPGDVVSHCYTGLTHGILDDHGLPAAVRDARAAGIRFDSAHGSSNFSFAVARRALDLGFPPDTISSDNSLRNWRGPVFDLATTMSKFLALGLTIDQVVERATIRPAELLGIAADGTGRIAAGGPANLTVLRLTDEWYDLRDATGATLSTPRLEPLYTVRAGATTACVPWRGAASAASEARI